MEKWQTLAGLRRDYGTNALAEETLPSSPLIQFKAWFEEILASEISDPTAMVLSTVDKIGHPDSRVVLLKGIEEESFLFFTNYESSKAMQLAEVPHVALNFYWPSMARQVRVRGKASRISAAESEAYFSSRPLESQIAAIVSPQSYRITDRKTLETAIADFKSAHENQDLKCPDNWGGYAVKPTEIEFWQGRDNRLHDRILYQCIAQRWEYHRLAP